jgi:hypothetical protein
MRIFYGPALKISINCMIIEMGISDQPFQESYRRYHSWVTRSLAKRLWEKVDEYGVTIVLGIPDIKLPRKRDKWLMREFVGMGYSTRELLLLNLVRIHQQVIFLSDILGSSGKSLDSRYLHRRGDEENWSTLQFPREKPPESAFRLWRTAIRQLVPPGGIPDRLGEFLHEGYKIWEWRHDPRSERVFHYYEDRMDVFRPVGPLRRVWEISEVAAPLETTGTPCAVREMSVTKISLQSTADQPTEANLPETFLDVLDKWGHSWMWKSLRLEGDDGWLLDAIHDGTLVAVADGSYIRELHPELCSAAFILECSAGRGRIVGSFPELSPDANAYRGELLGLLALHLILLAVNQLQPNLTGRAKIYSDCMSALERITDLPSGRIPSRIKHADILKILMVHCKNFSFGCSYLHVKAHQDDRQSYYALTRPAQLNCQVDFYAKRVIWGLEGTQPPPQDMLPLEALGVFAGKTKVTCGRGDVLRYWAHRTVAKRVFTKCNILMPDEFDEVAWRAVHSALWDVPRMFQIWATKQVMEIAGTNEMQSKYKPGHDKMCPSCSCRIETCGHVLFCQEEGRVDILEKSIDLLDDWLIDQNTNESLRFCIIDYARGRGGLSMREAVAGVGKATEFRRMADSQDKIGWRRFMEGMISKEILNLHYSTTCDSEEDMPTPSA